MFLLLSLSTPRYKPLWLTGLGVNTQISLSHPHKFTHLPYITNGDKPEVLTSGALTKDNDA